MNHIRWSTKYRDIETDLLYYGHRFFNPKIGRWTSRDPIGEFDGNNLYEFAGNNPVIAIDVLGLAKEYLCCTKKQKSMCQTAEKEALAATKNAISILQSSFRDIDIWLRYPKLQATSVDDYLRIRRWHSDLWRNLHRLESGLSRNRYSIKCEEKQKFENGVGQPVHAEASQSTLQHFWYQIIGKDYISVFPSWFDLSSEARSANIMHEGSHFFASTKDYYSGQNWRKLSLTANDATFIEGLHKNPFRYLNLFWMAVANDYAKSHR